MLAAQGLPHGVGAPRLVVPAHLRPTIDDLENAAGHLDVAFTMLPWAMWIGLGSWKVLDTSLSFGVMMNGHGDEVTHRQRIFVVGDMDPTVRVLVPATDFSARKALRLEAAEIRDQFCL